MKRLLWTTLALILFAGSSLAQQPGSITMDQPGPYVPGATLTFTATYDQEARKGNRTPQYPYHPQFQGFYSQGGVLLGYWLSSEDGAEKVTNNHDGTFTAHRVRFPFHPDQIPAWDRTIGGIMSIGVFNVKQLKDGTQLWTTYAWADFAVEPVP